MCACVIIRYWRMGVGLVALIRITCQQKNAQWNVAIGGDLLVKTFLLLL